GVVPCLTGLTQEHVHNRVVGLVVPAPDVAAPQRPGIQETRQIGDDTVALSVVQHRGAIALGAQVGAEQLGLGGVARAPDPFQADQYPLARPEEARRAGGVCGAVIGHWRSPTAGRAAGYSGTTPGPRRLGPSRADRA